jgi:hypothetical protein
MAFFKYIFIHYHNHHPQKQCTDVAPRALEQTCQTVTPSPIHHLYFRSPRRYLNYGHQLSLTPYHFDFIHTSRMPCHQRAHVILTLQPACYRLTRMHSFRVHSCSVASATSPIALTRACVRSFFTIILAIRVATSPITLARACLHSFSQSFSPFACLLPFCATHNTRQCQLTHNGEPCHSLRCSHRSHESHQSDARIRHVTFTLVRSCSHSHSFNSLDASLMSKRCTASIFDDIVCVDEHATSQFAQPLHVCQISLLRNLSRLVEGFDGHGMGFYVDVGVTIFHILFLISFPIIILHCHTTGGPVFRLWSASPANVPL